MMCVQFEDVSQYGDNNQWLFDEVSQKLVMILMNFVSYDNGFIKVIKCIIIIILIKMTFASSNIYAKYH